MCEINSSSLGNQLPHVCVLLATYNGSDFIEEQVSSIVNQQRVRVTIIASDDGSKDKTVEAILKFSNDVNIDILPSLDNRFGNANRNFMRLIRDASLSDADYFALSDQDDIWLPHKLLRAIECLKKSGAQGFSSNVTAFWPDGTHKLLKKSQPQQKLDFLFGSPGPGCTFVLPRNQFINLKQFVIENFYALQSIWVHDWLIYAFIRSRGGMWYIDQQSLMLYRQHSLNEFGANAGIRAAFRRYGFIKSGAYRLNILAIASVLCINNKAVQALQRFNFFDRLYLSFHARQFRRGYFESFVLVFFFLVMPRV